jgi:hypothetical protein
MNPRDAIAFPVVSKQVKYTEAPVAVRSYNVDVVMSGCPGPVVAELELGRAGLAAVGVTDPDDPNRQHEHTLLVGSLSPTPAAHCAVSGCTHTPRRVAGRRIRVEIRSEGDKFGIA